MMSNKKTIMIINHPISVQLVAITAKTAHYHGVRLNAKQYPPLYQFYVTADFRDYTARISADKRGGTLYRPPRHKTHQPVYKTYPRRRAFCSTTAPYTPPFHSPFIGSPFALFACNWLNASTIIHIYNSNTT